ncbi:MAG TPA: fluoride efflux transporter CrcB [Rhodospirillaceae bacterium]|nr:fluoride efflux transporter CrcB [Rhodospirillaceae bacterium]
MEASLLVAIGSAAGGTLRFWLSGVIGRAFGQSFPWGTLIINVTGSLAIGYFAALADGSVMVSGHWRQFFMIGVCGGYTTFSSFSLQTLTLAQAGHWRRVGGNIVLSVLLCLLAVCLGQALALGPINGR